MQIFRKKLDENSCPKMGTKAKEEVLNNLLERNKTLVSKYAPPPPVTGHEW